MTKVAADSLREINPFRSPPQDTTPLDPKFVYLRVTRGKHVGLLWRGGIEKDPGGPIEVFYSSSGEVLRLREGRLLAALGLATEWRRVEVSAPSWRAAEAAGQPVRYARTRDVMPGYRSGVRDALVLKVIPAPASSALRHPEPAALVWFEESREGAPGRLGDRDVEGLPPARYAVDFRGKEEVVVYAEQCLGPDVCFTWQRWSDAARKAAAAPSAP